MKEEFKILWPFYTSDLFNAMFALLSSYYVLYLLSIGFSFFQVSILLALTAFISFFFDIPTGAIADVFGRKTSVILSYLTAGILFILVPLSINFWYLFVIFFLLGISQTLSTGADEAWVLGNLKKEKREDLIDNYYAHRLTLQNAGVVIAPLIAVPVVALWGMKWLWPIEGASIILSGGILFL